MEEEMEGNWENIYHLPLGNICDANGKGGNMDAGIKSLDTRCKLAGPAFTVKGHAGDNLAIHRAIYEAPKGSVLVVDVAGYCLAGHFGEIMALACMEQGTAGLVIDGAVRDAYDMQELAFPVFSRGFNPGGTGKEYAGVTGGAIICGGVCVHAGDLIVGGRDGIVVVACADTERVLQGAQAIAKRELEIADLLRSGKTTLEIFQFKK